jgi:hypothetical protein
MENPTMKKIAVTAVVSLFLALGPACDGGDKKADGETAGAKKGDKETGDAAKDEAKDEAKPDEAKPDDKAAGPAPALITVVHHKVADYAKWKEAFDAHADARKAGGALAESVYQNADDPNDVFVVVPGGDVEKAKGMMASEDLKKAMMESGVQGEPEVWMFKPAGENPAPEGTEATVHVLVIHKVADFAKWKEGFDADAENRKNSGIVGHYIGQGLDDPNTVGVHLLATDAEKVKAMAGSEELKKAMADAGVQGEPQIWFTKKSHEKVLASADGAAPAGDADPAPQ